MLARITEEEEEKRITRGLTCSGLYSILSGLRLALLETLKYLPLVFTTQLRCKHKNSCLTPSSELSILP